MIERRQDLGFAREAREAIGFSPLRQQHLDRDNAIQLRIMRAIHLAHPAFADLGGDFIRADTRAGTEGHRI